TDNLQKARENERKAQYESDLQSDVEPSINSIWTRKRKPEIQEADSSDSSPSPSPKRERRISKLRDNISMELPPFPNVDPLRSEPCHNPVLLPHPYHEPPHLQPYPHHQMYPHQWWLPTTTICMKCVPSLDGKLGRNHCLIGTMNDDLLARWKVAISSSVVSQSSFRRTWLKSLKKKLSILGTTCMDIDIDLNFHNDGAIYFFAVTPACRSG
ncbi:unnamed protein product, partial [Cyprideis torosa]